MLYQIVDNLHVLLLSLDKFCFGTLVSLAIVHPFVFIHLNLVEEYKVKFRACDRLTLIGKILDLVIVLI